MRTDADTSWQAPFGGDDGFAAEAVLDPSHVGVTKWVVRLVRGLPVNELRPDDVLVPERVRRLGTDMGGEPHVELVLAVERSPESDALEPLHAAAAELGLDPATATVHHVWTPIDDSGHRTPGGARRRHLVRYEGLPHQPRVEVSAVRATAASRSLDVCVLGYGATWTAVAEPEVVPVCRDEFPQLPVDVVMFDDAFWASQRERFAEAAASVGLPEWPERRLVARRADREHAYVMFGLPRSNERVEPAWF